MEGRVKMRQAGSLPNTLGRQVGVLPVGNMRAQRRTSDRSLSVKVASDVSLREADEVKPPASSVSLHSTHLPSSSQTSSRTRKGSSKMSPKSQISKDTVRKFSGDGLQAELNSLRAGKADSSRKSKMSTGSSRILSSNSKVTKNNYMTPPGSSRMSAASSRCSQDNRRAVGNAQLAAGTDSLYDADDIDDFVEQDVKFIDVQQTKARPVSTISSNSKSGRKSSSAAKRDDSSRKRHKTIDPSEVLAQCMESDFYKVYEINQHACELTTIDNMEQFRKVKVLDLSCNCIQQIQNLEFNKDLRELKLYDNKIQKIEMLENLKELSTLQLQHNKIKAIGKGLQCLKKLRTLRLDCNRLLRIETAEIASCVQITVLDISYNMLDSLTALNYLTNLEELNASGNRLRTVTDLSKCRRLQEVDLTGNGLTDLSGLKGLPNLQTLNVTSNNLTSVKSVGKLKNLQDLHAGSNKLFELSNFPSQFPKLEVLDIPDNEITDWDEVCALEDHEELVELFLTGNPFSAQDGDMPHYFSAIQAVLPNLEIIDGVHIKRQTSKTAPIMRPMTASSIVSLRQMDSQMRNAAAEMQSLEKSLEEKFQSLRQTCDNLPAEPPRSLNSVLSTPHSGADTPSLSRCSSRSRIRDAQAFAASINKD